MLASGRLYPRLKLHAGPLRLPLFSIGTNHEATVDRPFPNILMIPQWLTNEILLARFKELGGRIEYDSALVNLAQSLQGVAVGLATGETVRADHIVGCDGGRSTVRKLLGLELQGKSLDDKTMIVADLELDGPLDRDFWHVWPLNRIGPALLCPLPGTNLF